MSNIDYYQMAIAEAYADQNISLCSMSKEEIDAVLDSYFNNGPGSDDCHTVPEWDTAR